MNEMDLTLNASSGFGMQEEIDSLLDWIAQNEPTMILACRTPEDLIGKLFEIMPEAEMNRAFPNISKEMLLPLIEKWWKEQEKDDAIIQS